MSEPKKIVWAVDPFDKDQSSLKSAAWAIHALVKTDNYIVMPVYFAALAALGSEIQASLGDEETLRTRGQQKMSGALNSLKIRGLQPLEILYRPTFVLRLTVRELVLFAKQHQAEMIVLATHGRKGIKRLALGSFAETLALLSDVPLFIVHPNWKKTLSFKQILFPTDFSEDSQKAFITALNFARERKSKITIFHRVVIYSSALFDPAFIGPFPEDYSKRVQTDVEKEAHRWMELARRKKVHTDYIIDHSHAASISETVLKLASKQKCMIALSTQSGMATALLLGSTSRQIIRNSEQPVWVIHPSKHTDATKSPSFFVRDKETAEVAMPRHGRH